MSYQATKTDPELGRRVSNYLKNNGANTPVIEGGLSDEDKITKIEGHFQAIMETLGLDLSDDSLQDTPRRVAKMYVREIFWGLDPDKFPKATTVSNKMGYSSMVVEKDITVMSACEHHFVTIDGKATVAYIPEDKVLGLSKLNRIVEYFSRRPQIQDQ